VAVGIVEVTWPAVLLKYPSVPLMMLQVPVEPGGGVLPSRVVVVPVTVLLVALAVGGAVMVTLAVAVLVQPGFVEEGAEVKV
jgi:hypothetical protein